MPYLGTSPQSGFITSDAEKITGQTTNYVNLSNAISSLDDVQVHVNYVIQDPSTLTLNSTTQIGLGDTLVSSDVVLITYLGKAVATQSPAENSVTNSMLAGSIANSKLANSSITLNGSAVSLGGSASLVNTPAFEAYVSSNQNIGDSTLTKIQFNTEKFDTANAYDNSTNYRFTPQTSGKYFVYASAIAFSSNGGYDDVQYVSLELYKSGSRVSQAIYDLGSRQRQMTPVISTIVDMNGSTDYLEVHAEINAHTGSGVLRGDSAKTHFGAYKIIE